MPAITIRNVPQVTRDELAARAAAKGQSLQDYLAALLRTTAEKPSLDEAIQRMRDHKRAGGYVLDAAEILAHTDADRR